MGKVGGLAMTGRPTALPVRLEAVPHDLRQLKRWVMWRYVSRRKPDGSQVWAKLPMTVDGKAASSTDARTWTTFDDVADALILGGFDGIGVVLGDGWHGIDLDECRDPVLGELTDLAQEFLQRVAGYAEVSPSGTGLKLIGRTNLDASRTKKEAGVECYVDSRYFTVTGHTINGHVAVAPAVQDVGWLVEKVWAEQLQAGGGAGAGVGDSEGVALELYRAPLEDWSLERVVAEVLPHLDPDSGYADWLQVGAALHHQGQGDGDWLQAWDDWSAGSGKWAAGVCEEKWSSFSAQRFKGKGAITLASLLKKTKEARDTALRADRDVLLQSLFDEIDAAVVVQDLEEKVAAKAARVKSLTDSERGLLAKRIVARNKALGGAATLDQVRGWLRYRSGVAGQGFAHVNEEGHPLCTLENLTALLRQLEITIRYNVISKNVEVLVPGASGSRDNRDNATLATVLSECEKVRMPTRHVPQFLLSLADQNLFNPVMTWITSQPWDGVSRLENFYATVVEAEDTPAEMKKLLMRKWLVQAVAAAASPDGIAAQGILTFTGEQNIGKTTWFRRLAPVELDLVKTGLTLDLKSKDSILTALRYWVVELGEVDATFRKSDISALKSFVTQDTDNIRRPYAMSESCYGRRTVFGASVNDEEFLADPTGNRRFWTIHAVAFQLDHTVDMQQLWAEAYELWKGGEAFHLDQGQVERLNTHNAQFAVTSPVFERLAGAFDWEGAKAWEWVTVTQALLAAGIREPKKTDTIDGSIALRKLNGKRRRKSNGKVLFAVPGDFQDFLEGRG